MIVDKNGMEVGTIRQLFVDNKEVEISDNKLYNLESLIGVFFEYPSIAAAVSGVGYRIFFNSFSAAYRRFS